MVIEVEVSENKEAAVEEQKEIESEVIVETIIENNGD